jgi:hypothetical protein
VQDLKSAYYRRTTAMMEQRVGLSKTLLVTVGTPKHRGWTRFLADGELGFWLSIDYEQ